MKLNLKNLRKKREILKHILSKSQEPRFKKDMNELLDMLEEIEMDLELGTECVIDLQGDRLKAIEERDKFLQFYNQMDDI